MESSAPITDAVILMAGTGSRLRVGGVSLAKPLVEVGGRPIFSYTVESLRAVGICRLHVVVGYESESLLAQLRPLVPPEIEFQPIHNPAWQKQNGISVLAAAPHLTKPFLLLMGDHLFERSLLQAFVRQIDPRYLHLAIDRKLDRIFDLDDAMKVRSSGDRLLAIGKKLTDYDAIDTGIFACPVEFFHYLETAKVDGDCSLADGVRAVAAADQMRLIDIGDGWWQDVDDRAMLDEAESRLTTPA